MDLEIEKIIRSRRKTVALQVTERATLIVRAPYHTRKKTILDIVTKHEKWIEKKRKEIRERNRETPAKRFVDGEAFLYLGKPYPLKIVNDGTFQLKFDDGFFLVQDARDAARKVFEDWYRKTAREIIPERVAQHSMKGPFSYNRIRITHARKRWGSCSPKGNLNFSWRLIMAPLPVIDYVVIHELVHLVERNHSSRFWGKVESLMPEFKIHRDWLKKNGYLLQVF